LVRRSILLPLGRGSVLALVVWGFGVEPTAHAADPQPYTVAIAPTGNGTLDQALSGSSNLVSLRQNAPVAPFALITRAQEDVSRLQTALGGFGYYDGHVDIRISGRALDDPGLPDYLEHLPANTSAPVTVAVTTGPLFHLRKVAIDGAVPPDVQAKLAPLHPGAPAVAADVLAAQGRIENQLLEDGHAFAKVNDPVAILDKPHQALDITFPATAGPRVDIGTINLAGLKDVNARFVRRILLLHPGEQFSPSKVEAARQDLTSLGVFSSVQATAAPGLNASGQLPVTFTFVERPKYAVNLGAAYSTDLGFQGSVSWTDRNLFGNAEQLILAANNTQLGGSASKAPGFDISATFIKPDFLRRDQQLQIDSHVLSESLEAYDRRAVTGEVLVTRKLDKRWTVGVGVAGEVERILQEEVSQHYALLGLPLTAKYDGSNDVLVPTSGIRANFSVTPTGAFPVSGAKSSAGFVIAQAQGSTYFDLSGNGHSVLALRATIGSALGASQNDVPPDKRFYAGGSATVRGYKFQTVSPLFPDTTPKGGLSLTAGTVEFRQRVWGPVGAVAFVDAGEVGSTPAPFTGTLRLGAGAGARYYSPIGPIRLDVAVPLNREPGGDTWELYIGLGEAF
jgi:translocation and assembly module TamA